MSSREFNLRYEQRFDVLGERHIFEVQFQSLFEVRESLINGLSLACNLNLQAARHEPTIFMGNSSSECGAHHSSVPANFRNRPALSGFE